MPNINESFAEWLRLKCQREAKSSDDGKAISLVENVAEVAKSSGQSRKRIEPIAFDDMYFLAKQMLYLQKEYAGQNIPCAVDIGFHYTSSRHLRDIRAHGLLTGIERRANSVNAKEHGRRFGDGVYTSSNPTAFSAYGDVGLIVGRLKGRTLQVDGTSLSKNALLADQMNLVAGANTIIGNRRGKSGSRMFDEIVLRSSGQCLPLIKYDTGLMKQSGGEALIKKQAASLQLVLDELFNNQGGGSCATARVNLAPRSHSPRNASTAFRMTSNKPSSAPQIPTISSVDTEAAVTHECPVRYKTKTGATSPGRATLRSTRSIDTEAAITESSPTRYRDPRSAASFTSFQAGQTAAMQSATLPASRKDPPLFGQPVQRKDPIPHPGGVLKMPNLPAGQTMTERYQPDRPEGNNNPDTQKGATTELHDPLFAAYPPMPIRAPTAFGSLATAPTTTAATALYAAQPNRTTIPQPEKVHLPDLPGHKNNKDCVGEMDGMRSSTQLPPPSEGTPTTFRTLAAVAATAGGNCWGAPPQPTPDPSGGYKNPVNEACLGGTPGLLDNRMLPPRTAGSAPTTFASLASSGATTAGETNWAQSNWSARSQLMPDTQGGYNNPVTREECLGGTPGLLGNRMLPPPTAGNAPTAFASLASLGATTAGGANWARPLPQPMAAHYQPDTQGCYNTTAVNCEACMGGATGQLDIRMLSLFAPCPPMPGCAPTAFGVHDTTTTKTTPSTYAAEYNWSTLSQTKADHQPPAQPQPLEGTPALSGRMQVPGFASKSFAWPSATTTTMATPPSTASPSNTFEPELSHASRSVAQFPSNMPSTRQDTSRKRNYDETPGSTPSKRRKFNDGGGAFLGVCVRSPEASTPGRVNRSVGATARTPRVTFQHQHREQPQQQHWAATTSNAHLRQVQNAGTALVPYRATRLRDGSRHMVFLFHSISAMTEYKYKSFEELRLEDYSMGNNGTKRASRLHVYCAPATLADGIPAGAMTSLVPLCNMNELCVICHEPFSDTECVALEKCDCVALDKCGHVFHTECIEQAFKSKPQCPICRVAIGSPQGKSPSGTMEVSYHPGITCAGHNPGSIIIDYNMPANTQMHYHDSPGVLHAQKKVRACLPSSVDGQDLLKRLIYAFMHGLTFSVGMSLTTGRNNVITWGSVHHKTSVSGGVRAHGFPDQDYFDNCNEELDGLGVPSADSLDENGAEFGVY